jgi:hypothetical protein
MRKTTPITRTERQGPGRDRRTRESHPAFGMVALSRVTGSPGKMFGSHLNRHAGFIELTVKRAVRDHDLHQDWHFGKDSLLQLRLTHTQFAELITTMNMGDGVPCTLAYLPGEEVPDIPDDLETEQEKVTAGFEDETQKFGAKVRKRFTEVEIILNKPGTITKKDREVIRNAMAMVIQDVEANMPFVLRQFVESTEKVAQQAKAEVEGFLSSISHKIGMEGLKERLLGGSQDPSKLLDDGKKK